MFITLLFMLLTSGIYTSVPFTGSSVLFASNYAFLLGGLREIYGPDAHQELGTRARALQSIQSAIKSTRRV